MYNEVGDIMHNNNLNVLKEIEKYGYEAYIVGGYVRDYYMKKESKDVDICTNALPMDLVKIFNDAILPKEKYGAVTLYNNGIRYEITTFRKELKYVNRKPVEIEYTKNLCEDLERRDFTINVLYMNSFGEIKDLFNGIGDINSKIIRSLGDATIKFRDDPLRILRTIRFATILNFKLDKNVSMGIKDNAHLLTTLSYERKKDELSKIFASNNAKYGIKLIKTYKLDKYLELNNFNKLKVTSDILGIWSQLDVINKYPFNKIEKDIINNVDKIINNKRISKYEIYKYGLYVSSIAAEILNINKKNIVNLERNLPIKSIKDINITTNELVKLFNKEPGKWIKEIYIDLEYKILYSKVKNEYNDIKSYILKTYI